MIEVFQIEINLLNIVQSLIGLFLSIALLQSGSDKIIDRKGNLEWLSSHFSLPLSGALVKIGPARFMKIRRHPNPFLTNIPSRDSIHQPYRCQSDTAL